MSLVAVAMLGLSACGATSTSDSGNTGALANTVNTGNTGSGGFCSTHTCIPSFSDGTGYIVQCADGEWSHSGGRPGACSDHGGETGNTAGNTGNTGNTGAPGNTGNTGAPPNAADNVTGTDAAGYNTGPGCSDDPTTPLPGCSDSPSVPAGHPPGTCAGGIVVDKVTTSCALAVNVKQAYGSDGTLTAYSPERGRTYTFNCFTGGSGTTGNTICIGHAGAAELYVRWHQ